MRNLCDGLDLCDLEIGGTVLSAGAKLQSSLTNSVIEEVLTVGAVSFVKGVRGWIEEVVPLKGSIGSADSDIESLALKGVIEFEEDPEVVLGQVAGRDHLQGVKI